MVLCRRMGEMEHLTITSVERRQIHPYSLHRPKLIAHGLRHTCVKQDLKTLRGHYWKEKLTCKMCLPPKTNGQSDSIYIEFLLTRHYLK